MSTSEETPESVHFSSFRLPPSGMWRSLEERADTPEFRSWLEREFPEQASEWRGDETSRRDFLRLMGASVAMAGAAGCMQQPAEPIVPSVQIPEYTPSSKPLFYATAAPMTGGAIGVLVESHEGRPTRVEGNELHPASLGATDVFAQASVLGLYDPDRSQVVRKRGAISHWDVVRAELVAQRDRFVAQEGRGLRILSPPVLSPTLSRQREQLLSEFPEARWHTYEPISEPAVQQGATLAFGEAVQTLYRFDEADVILSVDSDFLSEPAGRVRYARDFSQGRTIVTDGEPPEMSRLYAVESSPSLTGARADHRLPLSPYQIEQFVREVARRLGIEGLNVDESALGDVPPNWFDALLDDLQSASAPLVAVAPWQSAAVHALVHLINDRIGAAGTTAIYTEPLTQPDEAGPNSLAELIADIEAGEVESLLILESNPVFTAPGNLDIAAAIAKVPFSLHLGLEVDETAVHCTWHVPSTHYLEAWSDTRAYDGTASIVQPLIAPLYNGRNPHDVINTLLGDPEKTSYDSVREYWQQQYAGDDFEAFFRKVLHDGVIPNTSLPPKSVSVGEEVVSQLEQRGRSAANDGALTAVFRPHPSVWDGRFANNAWLQELPQPFTKLTWGNAALVDVETATQNGWRDGDLVSVATTAGGVRLPVMVVPGQAKGVVTLHFGCGRKRVGGVARGVGGDVFPLRTTSQRWTAPVELTRNGRLDQLPTTQHHFLMEGRNLVRSGPLDALREHPEHPPFMQKGHGGGHGGGGHGGGGHGGGGHGGGGHGGGGHGGEHAEGNHGKDHQAAGEHDETAGESMYPDLLSGEYQWGMSIDLTACIGCNACTIACQSENNIPVVGAKEVADGREMHWIRVDTYFEGEPENPVAHHQPVPCMHCEHAPCEVVCPVAATTHSHEGLNEMTYNRCIGTRYCSNNCPYKVRRFNFFDYQEPVEQTPVLHLLQNPDVSVRSRGVMEKCTYCVQRINTARINADLEERPIRDGEIVTACQSACPTRAIVFGNVADPDTAVSRHKRSPLDYGLLEDLNTRPRTTYLADLRNPHPLLKEDEA